MKFALKSFAAVVAFAAFGAAHAEVTLATGGTVAEGGWELSNLQGTGTLSFSKTLLTALNAGGIDVTPVDPALVDTVFVKGKYTSVSAAAPVASLTGSVSGGSLAVTGVATSGGALQSAFDDGLTNSGGSLQITNITVDLNTKAVYADIEGGNDVGTLNKLHVWNYTNISGATTADLVNGSNTAVNQLTGLTITKAGYDAFTQSLGLRQPGIEALLAVTDFGVIDSKITFDAAGSTEVVPKVPEASTYAMMALGLVGIGAVARRRAAK